MKKYLYRLPMDYDLPNIMLTAYFVNYKEKVAFPAITFENRQGGVNSVNIPKIVKTGRKALHDFWILRKSMME